VVRLQAALYFWESLCQQPNDYRNVIPVQPGLF
jgi:hypothetical protein